MSAPFINIHTHRPDKSESGIRLVNCFPNGTTTEFDYKENSTFSDNPIFPFQELIRKYNTNEQVTLLSCGIHPWYLEGLDHKKALTILEQLCKEKLIHAIGECGLSKRVGQEEKSRILFLNQLQLAEKYQLPFIIHCESEYNEMIRMFKAQKPKVPVIFHYFNSNIETAKELIKHGLFLSFGPGLTDQEKRSTKAFIQLPLENVFLETDDRNYTISTYYEAAAVLKNCTMDILKESLFNNFKKVFGFTNEYKI